MSEVLASYEAFVCPDKSESDCPCAENRAATPLHKHGGHVVYVPIKLPLYGKVHITLREVTDGEAK